MGIEGLVWGKTVHLKMEMCLVVKSSEQSIYGYPYHDVPKPYLDIDFNLLSLANLGDLHEAFEAARNNRQDQAQFQIRLNPNLLSGYPNTFVLI